MEDLDAEKVKQAFLKLQSFVYFDNYDLFLREKVALFKKDIPRRINNFISEINKKEPFKKLFNDSIKLHFLPKKVDCLPEGMPSNFYTNAKILNSNSISKPFVTCDFPIEFHLIAVLWLMKYGGFIDSKLSKNVLGNRLIINKDDKEVPDGRGLFKTYYKQFQKWWSFAMKATKDLLKKNENVTILNFDIQSYYHEVKFNFELIENSLADDFPDILNDPIHKILKTIHEKYKKKLYEYKSPVLNDEQKFPLPVGLLTSHLFANYYLLEFDSLIDKKVRPIYYGRYVDDIIIVLKDTVLDSKDVMENIHSNKSNNEINKTALVEFYLSTYFKNIFEINSDYISLKGQYDSTLRLNKEKIFVYQFDSEYSPNLLEKFVEEQKERSSMFRFLSDEEDELFEDFDNQTFESTFDNIDANKARFKNIEDNKYKISTFLSKLIRRRILKGVGYKEEEITKIGKYFKGVHLIKHYYFWEKIFTLYVASNNINKLQKLTESILKEISLIDIPDKKSINEFFITAEQYKKNLKEVLRLSLAISLGLNINLLSNNKKLQALIWSKIENNNYDLKDYSKEYREPLIKNYSVFKEFGLLRSAFIYFPLLQFTNIGISKYIDFTNNKNIFDLFLHLESDVKEAFEIPSNDREFIPFRIKYWQAALLIYYKNLLGNKPPLNTNILFWNNDFYSSYELLDDAFQLFYSINRPKILPEDLKDEYFNHFTEKERIMEHDTREPQDRNKNYYVQEIYFKNGGPVKEKIRVCIVNKFVDLKNFESSLEGKPIINPDRVEIFDQIWDQVSLIEGCDIFAMPELCLPHQLINNFVDQSARNQIGFISGIEHINLYNVGFNFLLTVLPINIDGDKDCIPIFRLKNHYGPEEETWIRGKRIIVPKPNPYRYDLFEWKGFYFSNYYCFELADIFHRSIFFSKVDAIFAPVWNVDTHYYNSIIDTATRDMHSYFILINTSQYGHSKISRPRDYINKEKVVVKGGTQKEYPYTLLVGDLKIKELRDFQLLNFTAQKEKNKDKKSFKPTPPDFPLENVRKRINNERFFKN